MDNIADPLAKGLSRDEKKKVKYHDLSIEKEKIFLCICETLKEIVTCEPTIVKDVLEQLELLQQQGKRLEERATELKHKKDRFGGRSKSVQRSNGWVRKVASALFSDSLKRVGTMNCDLGNSSLIVALNLSLRPHSGKDVDGDLDSNTVPGKYVRSGCTTALSLFPGEQQTANLFYGNRVQHEIVLLTAMTNTQTPPTVVNTTGAPVTNAVANHAEKPEKFNVEHILTEGQSSNAQAVQAVEAWKHSDFLCHNYVLNGLIDPLYNVYCKTTTAKELWESLERKYKTEDAGTKKFVVARFLDYKMVDSKSVVSQVQDLQVLLHDIHAEGKWALSETFKVVLLFKKLPPSGVEFKKTT
ncbi:hypothetical protein Tco_0183999 [Tanacetum coccineum]